MAKLLLELPYSYCKEDIAEWLSDRSLVHLKSHGNHWITTGDALKSSKGVIARVVDTCRNEVGEPFITIANNKLSREEMDEQFDCPIYSKPGDPLNAEGLRYVSESVGWVDQDEEYY